MSKQIREPGTTYKLTIAWKIGERNGKPFWHTNETFHETLEHAEQRLAHSRANLRVCILRYKIRKITTVSSGEYNPIHPQLKVQDRIVPIMVIPVNAVQDSRGSPPSN